MNDEELRKWLEISWQRPLTPEEKARLEARLSDDPQRRAQWEQESALNRLLDQLPPAPALSSNFTARVMAAVERDDRPRPASRRERSWIRAWLPRWAGAFLAVAVAWVGLRTLRSPDPESMTEPIRIVGATTEVVPPEALKDFEVVSGLGPAPPEEWVDMELLAALE